MAFFALIQAASVLCTNEILIWLAGPIVVNDLLNTLV